MIEKKVVGLRGPGLQGPYSPQNQIKIKGHLRFRSDCLVNFDLSGGPLVGQTQLFFLTIEVSEIIPYRQAKPYEDVSFLTNLYLQRGWRLRRISNKLGCCKATVRKKLVEAGIEIKSQSFPDHRSLKNKFEVLKNRGLSYQAIAGLFTFGKSRQDQGKGSGMERRLGSLPNSCLDFEQFQLQLIKFSSPL